MSGYDIGYETVIGNYLKVKIIEKKPSTFVFGVYSRSNECILGVIKWYANWRGYCFIIDVTVMHKDGVRELVYSPSCMDDISSFIKKLMEERKK